MTGAANRNPGAPSWSAGPSTSDLPEAPSFDAVPRRARHDGWTADRQVAFIEALAACGCVEEACGRVGMSRSAAYALRAAESAHSFRRAWDMALEAAVQVIADAAFARAIKGVEQPIFYKGEQVGVRIRHDERLVMFLLRQRAPERYGAWRDRCDARREDDGAARDLAAILPEVVDDARRADEGDTRYRDWTPPFPVRLSRPDPKADTRHERFQRATQEEVDETLMKLIDSQVEELKRKERQRHLKRRELHLERRNRRKNRGAKVASPPRMAATSSTSAAAPRPAMRLDPARLPSDRAFTPPLPD